MSAASDLLANQQSFIRDLQSDASTAISNATNDTIFPVYKDPGALAATPKYTPKTPPQPPQFQLIPPPVIGQTPEMSGSLMSISSVFSGSAPEFSARPPLMDFGTLPSQISEFTDNPPTIDTSFDFPEMPGELSQVFTPPVLGNHATPNKPQYSLPSFGAQEPGDAPTAPTDITDVFEDNFANMHRGLRLSAEAEMDAFLAKINPKYHSQMGKIEAQLERYLAGGSGMRPEVEDAIYSRAREKNDVEAARVRDAAYAEAASRGFTLPSGALISAVGRARQEAANNNLKAASDIVVMQAEMEQKNLQFAVSTSADIRKNAVSAMLTLYQTSLSLVGQAMDYAKNVANSLIQIYDAEVKAFSVRLDLYKTQASVYETKSRTAMIVVDLYKAEIQALEALTNVDKAKVDIYRAQLGSLQTYADIYKAKVDAVVSEASLEKLKIDLYQGQVQAYTAKVQAKSAEWQGYQARLSGEESKAKLFATQADAFNAQVNAFKAQIEASAEQIKGETAYNSGVVQELVARIGAYEADIKAQTAVAAANTENLRQFFTAHRGMLDHAIAVENMSLEGYKVTTQAAADNYRAKVQGATAEMSAKASALNGLAGIHDAILKVYSGPASAAAAGMNSLASINFDE